ncbi:sigma factor [Lentzea sp. NPDC051213]|uniref:sigma factor n=1 Tax=Lentzea sp. NPDC051213 TaxID=3364126 RepID=UPI00379D51A8
MNVRDEALVRSLYELHGRALLSYAMRLSQNRRLAEDVVQETLVRAWRQPHSLGDSKASARAQLLTMARTITGHRGASRTRPRGRDSAVPTGSAAAARCS